MEREKLGGKNYTGKQFKGSANKLPKKNSQLLAQQNHNSGTNRLSNNNFQAVVPREGEAFYGDALYSNGVEGAGSQSFDNKVSINLDYKSKKELSELKTKLQSELHQVRNLMKRIEQYSGTKQHLSNGVHGKKLKRVHSEVGSVDGLESRPTDMLTMSEGKNRGVGVSTGKAHRGTRMPAVAQMQKKLDAVPGKEKDFLPVHSKKPKANGKMNREDDLSISGMQNSSSKVFKSCSSLLAKMMRNKNGWVFNTPVDVKALGLVDYFTIIKHPMDLGTVKSRLSTNWYRTPDEFAEDVRLTFRNAIKYNLDGHEVNTLAKEFLKMFENKWLGIEADYLHQLNTPARLEADHPTPLPTIPPPIEPQPASPVIKPLQPPPPTAPSPPPGSPPADMAMIGGRSEAVTKASDSDAKRTSVVASVKPRLPKPKAKDQDKRDMTLEEKEKLSESLQNLPSEKLEGVLKIIKKRNPSLYQNDDEIEVDIDTVDNETLWELDRFVIYYRKAVSKIKRSALLGQIGVLVEPSSHEKSGVNGGIEVARENEDDEEKMFSSSSNRGGQEGRNASDSDGSSSSSSDSGSSSSGMIIDRKWNVPGTV
ncbi:hypothetical protein V2J09_002704 [Rumex salicifolius]